MIECPTCHKENEDFFSFCLGCGSALEIAGAATTDAGDVREHPTVTDFQKADLPDTSSDLDAMREESADSGEAPGDGQHDASDPGEDPIAPAAGPGGDGGPALRCDTCGVLSPPTFAFCGHCGQPLDGAEPLPLTRAADVSTPREEQRVVRGQLVVVGEDGEDGASFDLFEGINVMGREADCLAFPDDDFMSTPHAEFHVDDGGLEVRPADTTNGVFYRLDKSHALSTGDEIRLGQELLRMHLFSEEMGRNGGGVQADVEGTVSLGSVLPEAVWGKLEQVLGPGAHGSVFLLAGDEVNIGREQGDVVFPKDGYVSGTHARIVRCDDHASIEDLGSSNGTYVRLSDTRRLEDGDHILAGQQLLRVDL